MSELSWIVLYGLLSSYCLAGCLTEHFAIIRGWLYVGNNEFRDVHIAQGNGIGYVYVLPKIALTALIGFFFFDRPVNMPWAHLCTSAAAIAASWSSTFLIQFPIQTKIRLQKKQDLVLRLYRTDAFRVIAMAAHNVVVWALILRFL